MDLNTIEVRFYERGVGERPMSSGTGSTGAACCRAGRAKSSRQIRSTVLTPAGPLTVEERDALYLTGPAVIVAETVFHLD